MTWTNLKAQKPERNLKVEFRNADGSTFIGVWAPYWCGSDCPCVIDEDDRDEIFNSDPDCWCAYEEGVKNGRQIDPVDWRNVAA